MISKLIRTKTGYYSVNYINRFWIKGNSRIGRQKTLMKVCDLG